MTTYEAKVEKLMKKMDAAKVETVVETVVEMGGDVDCYALLNALVKKGFSGLAGTWRYLDALVYCGKLVETSVYELRGSLNVRRVRYSI